MDFSKFLVEGGDYRSFPLFSLDIKEAIILLEDKIEKLREDNSYFKSMIINYQRKLIEIGGKK